jgi:class 3 adenylate cyclase
MRPRTSVAVVGHRRQLLVAIKALHGAAAPDKKRASAERRQITVLFCDIVGSTPLSTQLDPEELRDLLSAFQLNVTAAVTSTGVGVARVIGDGLLIYFGWPHADEAHAESAVRAGLVTIDTTPRTNHQHVSASQAALC